MSKTKDQNLSNINSYSSLELFEDLGEYLKKLATFQDFTKTVKKDDRIIDKTLSDIKLSKFIRNNENQLRM